ncbi:MAG TPA: hypothetical protein VFO46_02465 [Candidatus Sulfotelmatobacter sp.]|nr:hypothetical protein [Candidatus Sulfotelmatobacter sp.]
MFDLTQMHSVGRGMEFIGTANNVEDVNAVMAGQGFSKRRISNNRAHEWRIAEAGRLLADVIEGRTDPFLFKEALFPQHEWAVAGLREQYPRLFAGGNYIGLRETMSYSDYSALTVDIIDRLLYGYYTAAPTQTMVLVKKRPLRDFRLVARYGMDGAVAPFTRMPGDTTITPHGAGEPPTERSMQQAAREVTGSTQRVTYQPQLYQGMMSVNWRALVNDDLGIFNDATQRLAISGNRTISQFITSLYIATGGANTTLYNSTFKNLCTTTYGASSNNPPLSFQGLLDAMTVLAKQMDLDGQPIQFDGTIYLWHGPALKTTAMSLSKAIQADISVGGGTTNTAGFPSQRLRIDNWPMQGVVPVEDKWIPIVCTTSGIKDTIWGLTYDPNVQARPSLEYGYLNGFETPQLYQELPNTMRVGGGTVPEMGNFYTMNQNYKGILVLGGTQIDGRSTVVSTGAGS